MALGGGSFPIKIVVLGIPCTSLLLWIFEYILASSARLESFFSPTFFKPALGMVFYLCWCHYLLSWRSFGLFLFLACLPWSTSFILLPAVSTLLLHEDPEHQTWVTRPYRKAPLPADSSHQPLSNFKHRQWAYKYMLASVFCWIKGGVFWCRGGTL